MADANLVLVAGTYAEAGAAADDYKALKAGEAAGEYHVVAAVVMNRDADGTVDVQEHDSGAHVAGGAVLGGTAGLVVGLFAPPLLAATAVGAGIGAIAGKLSKKHQEKELGVELEEYLPRDPRLWWLSSMTSGPTRSEPRSSKRTSGSTRQSTRATTTSSRRLSRSLPTRSRTQSRPSAWTGEEERRRFPTSSPISVQVPHELDRRSVHAGSETRSRAATRLTR